ncbi:ABC transporter substrate-binding protein [Pseudonocardia sp. CNS-004]|nr:ABC transporter substrate-binding protein [Pseudonocardia sp. CNS-004]
MLHAGAAAFGAATLGPVAAACGTSPARSGAAVPGEAVPEETRTLDQLHAEALAEGGRLVVYAGGDTPTQLNGTEQAFRSRFPGMKPTVVVDYGKFHGVRVDSQVATGTVVPDVVQLPTLHDFPRWKEEGLLLPYRPAGFSTLPERFRDPDGAWLATAVVALSYVYDDTSGSVPATPLDLVDPRWRGKIASSYPQDDDGVLFLYREYVMTYGWGWAEGLAAQDVQFSRGTHSPAAAVGAGQKSIGIGGPGSPVPASAPRWVVPVDGPFLGWGQRSAILAGARHPAAARLYLNWLLSVDVQRSSPNGWSVRTDVIPHGGLEPIWEYPSARIDEFAQFMDDRAEVERWRQTFALHFGEVQGPPTTGTPGLHPGLPVV